tara:strand:+ start:180 stop:404 length:225 start_codon:yes stop_codon:yes gene_type:complete
MKFFKYFQKIIKIINTLEALTTILDNLAKTTEKSILEQKKTLPISAKAIQKLQNASKKISKFDKTLEDLQAKLK